MLYLLRRELIETIGYDPNVNSETDVDAGGSRNRLFASLLLMFTMVDLLAEFMFGDTGGVGDRFKHFLHSPDGGGKPTLDAELLWSVRNSLVHAFGLPESRGLEKARISAVGIGQRKQVTLRGSAGLVVTERQGDTAIVYVDGLFRTVAESIDRYRRTLAGSASAPARARFATAVQTLLGRPLDEWTVPRDSAPLHWRWSKSRDGSRYYRYRVVNFAGGHVAERVRSFTGHFF